MERFWWIFFSAFWRRASHESGQFDPKKRDCKKGGPCPHLLLWRGFSEHKSGEQPPIRKEERIHGMSDLFQYKKKVQCAQNRRMIKQTKHMIFQIYLVINIYIHNMISFRYQHTEYEA